MKTKSLFIVVLIIGIVVVGTWLVRFIRASTTRQPPKITIDDKPKAAPPVAKEDVRLIQLNDVLIISHDTMSIDRKPAEKIPCDTSENGAYAGSLEIAPGVIGGLRCIDDYMGGTRLIVSPEGAKEPLVERLGLVFGDAGELSDTRSWVTKKPSGLEIMKATVYSATDIDNDAAIDCTSMVEMVTYDPKAKNFKRADLAFDANQFVFDPPPVVDERCQN